MPKYIVGIDEVGRGPLAGPITVGLVVMPVRMPQVFFASIRDSKKLTPKKREEWFQAIKSHKKLAHAVVSISALHIDKYGISHAARVAIERGLAKLAVSPASSYIMLDAGLRAPREFRQESIIRGDEKIPVIAAASIMAKVTRDRAMMRFHTKYPAYGFASHKGYGAKVHILNIQKYGLSTIHRKTFCTRINRENYRAN
ncbi:MAG: ribonuclease HII [Patescibacteria group bacterium]